MLRNCVGWMVLSAVFGQYCGASYFKQRPIEVRQPDGTSFVVTLTGDEFYSKMESPKGYTLIRDPRTGWYDFARPDKSGTRLESRGIHYVPGQDGPLMGLVPG